MKSWANMLTNNIPKVSTIPGTYLKSGLALLFHESYSIIERGIAID